MYPSVNAEKHSSEPLYVFIKLEDITVNEKQDAMFECELSHEDVDVTWYRDGAKVIKSASVFMEADGCKARLILKNVSEDEDNGADIQCRAEDAITSATLTVLPTILEILDPLDDKYTCSEGNEYTFQVNFYNYHR